MSVHVWCRRPSWPRCQSPCTNVVGRCGEPARHTASGSPAAARRMVMSSVRRSIRLSRCAQPCGGTRDGTGSVCSPASNRPASAHGRDSGCGATVSTRGHRVRQRVPTGSGTVSRGDSRDSEAVAIRSRTASARGSVPGRCSL
jgi:hypothetical protein